MAKAKEKKAKRPIIQPELWGFGKPNHPLEWKRNPSEDYHTLWGFPLHLPLHPSCSSIELKQEIGGGD